ncbi:hypothetical protein CEXT_640861 [Caerostris extrusa]|uniref:Uncharacterized protein n=1 Tax=Caerostris extrusa TaxID=172846 RepID=A0AAV4MUT5_CAEEX|nr:hypothetical protein CEXT_640861 [Caerostris extrusa]
MAVVDVVVAAGKRRQLQETVFCYRCNLAKHVLSGMGPDFMRFAEALFPHGAKQFLEYLAEIPDFSPKNQNSRAISNRSRRKISLGCHLHVWICFPIPDLGEHDSSFFFSPTGYLIAVVDVVAAGKRHQLQETVFCYRCNLAKHVLSGMGLDFIRFANPFLEHHSFWNFARR